MPYNFSSLLDKEDLRKQPAELAQICKIIFSTGKRLRSQLVSAVGSFIGLKESDSLLLSRIVEYIHNSSLLHDDFIDHSRTRRNKKTAWLEYSPSQAVLAGDYLLAKVNIYLAERGNRVLIQETAKAICDLASGEFLQRSLMPFQDTSLKKRDRVNELKTASLFKWCLRAPFICENRYDAQLHKTLDRVGLHIGLLFQRSDDLMDFSVRNKDQKPYLADIRQKHFNSFACFLLKGASPQTENRLKKAQSMSSVYPLFPDFKNQVQAFDRLNSKVIEKTKKDLEGLRPFLRKKEQALISSLQKWLDLVYWRDSR